MSVRACVCVRISRRREWHCFSGAACCRTVHTQSEGPPLLRSRRRRRLLTPALLCCCCSTTCYCSNSSVLAEREREREREPHSPLTSGPLLQSSRGPRGWSLAAAFPPLRLCGQARKSVMYTRTQAGKPDTSVQRRYG